MRVSNFNRIHFLLYLPHWFHFFDLATPSFAMALSITIGTRKHVELRGEEDWETVSACGDAHFDKSLRSSSSLPRLPFLISWRGSTSNSPECFRPDVSLGLSLPPSTTGSFLFSSRFGRRVTLFRIPLYRIYQHPAEHAYLYDILCILFRRGKYRHFYMHTHIFHWYVK